MLEGGQAGHRAFVGDARVTRYVIDASVYVSRLKASEVDHPSAKRLLDTLQAQQVPVSCPTLLWPEVASAVARGTQDPALGRAAAVSLRRLPFHTFVPLDHRLARLASELAAKCSLRGADAVYVALAKQLDCPLVTLDADQRNRAAGIVATCSPEEMLSRPLSLLPT
ncbi:MAG: type II toxin-antitoxin system VapC family toxin [Chloroflexi bacterium]|nr:type II toxin-antitoxin system VapC family toxin [Chloroflexota bacterium]